MDGVALDALESPGGPLTLAPDISGRLYRLRHLAWRQVEAVWASIIGRYEPTMGRSPLHWSSMASSSMRAFRFQSTLSKR